jgi:hypothetical protein
LRGIIVLLPSSQNLSVSYYPADGGKISITKIFRKGFLVEFIDSGRDKERL